MKRITTLIFEGKHSFELATTTGSPFAKLGKFVAISSKDLTDGRTNRPLTGLDVITGQTVDEVAKGCLRYAKHIEYTQAYPMPEFDPTNPSPDFLAWSKSFLEAMNPTN